MQAPFSGGELCRGLSRGLCRGFRRGAETRREACESARFRRSATYDPTTLKVRLHTDASTRMSSEACRPPGAVLDGCKRASGAAAATSRAWFRGLLVKAFQGHVPGLPLLLRALASGKSPHPPTDEVRCPLKRQGLHLRPKNVNTRRPVTRLKKRLPVHDPLESDYNQLVPPKLPSARVDPDHGLALFCAQKDHVMVRGHHNLVRLFRVLQNRAVVRSTRGCTVLRIADVADAEIKRAQCLRYSRGK